MPDLLDRETFVTGSGGSDNILPPETTFRGYPDGEPEPEPDARDIDELILGVQALLKESEADRLHRLAVDKSEHPSGRVRDVGGGVAGLEVGTDFIMPASPLYKHRDGNVYFLN